MNTLFRLFAFVIVIFLAGTSDAKLSGKGTSTMKTIEVVVHRGANYLAPENTVPSALKALEHGATWVELDVRKSKDGVLYNLHDETLDRTTDGH